MKSVAALISAALCSAAVLQGAVAQDPAPGWLSYAMGNYPGGGRMTHFSAKWKVLDNPQSSQAFYSPWIGAGDPAHKLLIQPVNPWTGDGWQTYNEIYSWYTGGNFNSNSAPANAGDVLLGSMDYTPHNGDSVYTIKNTNTASGWSVTTPHAMPSYAPNMTTLWIVFEKSQWPCGDYPPNEIVTFFDIKVEFDNVDVTDQIQWQPLIKDDHCDFRTHINSSSTVSITWDTQGSSSGSDDYWASKSANLRGADILE